MRTNLKETPFGTEDCDVPVVARTAPRHGGVCDLAVRPRRSLAFARRLGSDRHESRHPSRDYAGALN